MIAWAVAGVINGDVAFAGFAVHDQVVRRNPSLGRMALHGTRSHLILCIRSVPRRPGRSVQVCSVKRS